MDNWLVRARCASRLAPDECARALGLSLEEYAALEERPGTISLNELRALTLVFNHESRLVVWEWLHEFEEA